MNDKQKAKYLLEILTSLREWATEDICPPKNEWDKGYDYARNYVRLQIPDFKKKKQGSLKR